MIDPPEPQPPAPGEPQPPSVEPEPRPPSVGPEAQPAPEPYPFWGYGDLVFLIAAAFVLLLLVGGIGLLLFKTPLTAGPALITTFAFEGLWFLVLYGVMRVGHGRPFWRSLGWVRSQRGFWDAFGWGLLTALISIVLSSLIPAPHTKTLMEELLESRASMLMVGIFAITLGPLFEELAFRGFLQPLLVRTFGVAGGVLLQAVPFAVLHGKEYAWNWQQLIVMLFAGAAFGWMRQRTGSTAASTYMHAGFNFVVFLGMMAESFVRK